MNVISFLPTYLLVTIDLWCYRKFRLVRIFNLHLCHLLKDTLDFTNDKNIYLPCAVYHAILKHNALQVRFSFFKIYLFLAVLGLCCCAQGFSSCRERGLLFIVVRRLLIAVASCCGARVLGTRASVVVVHGLSCSTVCGIFLDQGSNPCPLHWQADS